MGDGFLGVIMVLPWSATLVRKIAWIYKINNRKGSGAIMTFAGISLWCCYSAK